MRDAMCWMSTVLHLLTASSTSFAAPPAPRAPCEVARRTRKSTNPGPSRWRVQGRQMQAPVQRQCGMLQSPAWALLLESWPSAVLGTATGLVSVRPAEGAAGCRLSSPASDSASHSSSCRCSCRCRCRCRRCDGRCCCCCCCRGRCCCCCCAEAASVATGCASLRTGRSQHCPGWMG